MAVLFAGNEIEMVTYTDDSGDNIGPTSNDVAVPGVNRAGVFVRSRKYIEIATGVEHSSGWVHARLRSRTSAGTAALAGAFFSLSTENDEPFFQLIANTSNLRLDIQITDHTEQLGILTEDQGVPFDLDVHFDIAEEGFVDVYHDQELRFSFQGDTRPGGVEQGFSKVTLRALGAIGSQDSGTCRMGHLIFSEESTLGALVYTLELSEGNEFDWAGVVGNVTGTSLAAVGEGIESEAPGDNAVFAYTMPPLPNNLKISDVFFASSAIRLVDSDVGALSLVADDGSSVIDSGIDIPLNPIFETIRWTVPKSFIGGLDWTPENLNSLQLGFVSKAEV